MARQRVPEFGKWEKESVPYTAFFEKARKDRGKMINPNDPEENPNLLSDNDSLAQAPTYRTKEPPGQPASRSRREQYSESPSAYKQYAESPSHYRQYAESPLAYNAGGRAAGSKSTYQSNGGSLAASNNDAQKRVPRSRAGSESGSERPPLNQQAKRPTIGVEEPTHGSRQGTPGRPGMKPVNNSPRKVATLPQFGEWNKGTPSSGDGYTVIFDRRREDKRKGEGFQAGTEVKVKPTASPSNNREQRQQTPTSNESSKACCFPWSGK